MLGIGELLQLLLQQLQPEANASLEQVVEKAIEEVTRHRMQR